MSRFPSSHPWVRRGKALLLRPSIRRGVLLLVLLPCIGCLTREDMAGELSMLGLDLLGLDVLVDPILVLQD